ncbi:MAG: HAD-IIA family hydrolase [Abitibacteriaceae bacterium]|nr:HAD-IIA family hydrolase [Abditibacteriaceae bacterium]
MNDDIKSNNQAAEFNQSGFNLRALDNFIFDLDGVIWRGNTAIEGAVESVARLRAAGKRCFYCTNNSSRTQSDFATRLKAIGLEMEKQHVITSSSATALYLADQFKAPFSAYVIGGEGIVTALQSIGAQVFTGSEADGFPSDTTAVDCVVVGIDRAFTYDKLRLAQHFILKGAGFIATNRDATFPTENGVVPGAGSLVASVETASGVHPVEIGKPQPLMLQLALEQFHLPAATTVMVGDRLDTDIACAHRAGIPALLVTTGVTTMAVALEATGEYKPDAIFENLPAMCHAVLGD